MLKNTIIVVNAFFDIHTDVQVTFAKKDLQLSFQRTQTKLLFSNYKGYCRIVTWESRNEFEY